jgi:hypothetical protein
MRRFSAFIAALTLIGTIIPAGAFAQAQTKSTQTKCFNSQTCETQCRQSDVGKNCAKVCAHKASILPPCRQTASDKTGAAARQPSVNCSPHWHS